MKIVIVNFAQNIRTLGVMNVTTYLKAHDLDSQIIFVSLPHGTGALSPGEEDSLAAAVARMKPDIIGCSLTTVYFRVAAQFTARVRKDLPGVLTVWGGIHATVAPEETLEQCDAACIGEGEESFLEFVQRVKKGGDYHLTPGFHVKRDGQTYRNDVLPLCQDMESRPFPRIDWENLYGLIDGEVKPLTRERFVKYSEMVRSMYDIMASRGCPLSCAYCCNSTLKGIYQGKGRFLRFRPVEDVMAELEYARSEFPEVKLFNFQDDSFGSAKEDYLTRFSELYRERMGLPFHIRVIPGMTSEKKISIMKECGLISAVMGLQSSDRINQEVFQRRTTSTQFLEMANLLHKYRIAGRYDAIVSNPYGTVEDEVEIIQTFLKVPKPYRLNIYALAFFPFTKLTERAIEDGHYDPVAAGYEAGYGDAQHHIFPELVGILGMTPYTPKFQIRFFLWAYRYRWGKLMIRAYYYSVFLIEWKLINFIVRRAKRMMFVKDVVFKFSELAGRLRLRKRQAAEAGP